MQTFHVTTFISDETVSVRSFDTEADAIAYAGQLVDIVNADRERGLIDARYTDIMGHEDDNHVSFFYHDHHYDAPGYKYRQPSADDCAKAEGFTYYAD